MIPQEKIQPITIVTLVNENVTESDDDDAILTLIACLNTSSNDKENRQVAFCDGHTVRASMSDLDLWLRSNARNVANVSDATAVEPEAEEGRPRDTAVDDDDDDDDDVEIATLLARFEASLDGYHSANPSFTTNSLGNSIVHIDDDDDDVSEGINKVTELLLELNKLEIEDNIDIGLSHRDVFEDIRLPSPRVSSFDLEQEYSNKRKMKQQQKQY